MKTLRLLCLSGALLPAALLLAASPSAAAPRTYRATWSGAAHGNTAQAVATLVIEEDYLLMPGESSATFANPNRALRSFDITVFGAGSGNGTWSEADFTNYFLFISDALDRFSNWVGQAQPTTGTPWGKATPPFSGEFNVFNSTAGAPRGVDPYTLSTNGGSGDLMSLTSFLPASAPGALVMLGDGVYIDCSVFFQPGGDNLRVTGLPAGLRYSATPVPNISGVALGMVGAAGVKIQVRQGTRVLRTIPFNLAVEPYAFAGGFEVLLEDDAFGFHWDESIQFPAGSPASINPSIVTVSDVPGTVTGLRVKLNGLSHTYPDDLDIFLMSPSGAVCALMSDAGGNHVLSNVNLVFDDSAPVAIPDSTAITSGRYRPANHGEAEPLPPTGTGSIGTSLNALIAGGVNGDWKLFISDDVLALDGGSLASWSLEFVYPQEPVGKLKLNIANPSPRNPNPSFTATLERLGEPRRSARGSFFILGSPQTLPLTFPATPTLPAATYDLVLTAGSVLVSGVEKSGDRTATARGARLIRLGRIPGGNPAVTMLATVSVPGDSVQIPAGVGHATGRVNARGLVPLRGLLADAQPFTASLCLTHTSQAVVWITPYRNKRSYLGGILGFGNLDVPGHGVPTETLSPPRLKWRVAPDPAAKAYPAGFEPLTMFSLASQWVPKTTAEALAETAGLNGRQIYLAHLLPPPGPMPYLLSLRNDFTLLDQSAPGAAKFSGRISGGTGSFTGSMRSFSPPVLMPVRGVLMPFSPTSPSFGMGLVKIPLSGPGLPRGSYRTSGFVMLNTPPTSP